MQTIIAGNARPVLDFAEPLTSKNCIDLIDRIRGLRDDYFFAEVQLRLSSPGGKVVALEYFLDAARELRFAPSRFASSRSAAWREASCRLCYATSCRCLHPAGGSDL